jgi:hypothetical protein
MPDFAYFLAVPVFQPIALILAGSVNLPNNSRLTG